MALTDSFKITPITTTKGATGEGTGLSEGTAITFFGDLRTMNYQTLQYYMSRGYKTVKRCYGKDQQLTALDESTNYILEDVATGLVYNVLNINNVHKRDYLWQIDVGIKS